MTHRTVESAERLVATKLEDRRNRTTPWGLYWVCRSGYGVYSQNA